MAPLRILLLVVCMATLLFHDASIVMMIVAQHAPFPPNGDALFYPLESPSSAAACLDGSQYGYFYSPARQAETTEWTLFLQGGGWCWNETDCAYRSRTPLGSSTFWNHRNLTCTCFPHANEDEDDCHCVFLPYCDGASFSGYLREAWPVEEENSTTLFFRGLANWQETIQDLMKRFGLGNATRIVWTGSSAGGLASLLQVDAFHQFLQEQQQEERHEAAAAVSSLPSPPATTKTTTVVALMQNGYFLDHDTAKNEEISYSEQIRSIFHLQNVSVSPACLASFPGQPHYCMLAPHAISYVQTPLFVLNSKFDLWQILHILKLPSPSDAKSAILQYGRDFEAQAQTIERTSGRRGAFITSCICHGCLWEHLPLDNNNKTGLDYFAEWLEDLNEKNPSSSTRSHFTMDPSTIPNANNTLPAPYCKPFGTSLSSSALLASWKEGLAVVS